MGSMTNFINKKSSKGVFFFVLLLLFPIMAANAGSWTWIGPDAGSVHKISHSPNYNQDHTSFAASKNNGVLKSTDGGQNWTPVNTGLTSLRVHAVALSPNFGSDRMLYAGTAEGVFRSINGGQSWKPMSNGMTNLNIDSFEMSPSFSSDSTLLAGSNGDGVFISTDGGNNWAAVNSGISNLYINSVAFSPAYASDGTLYAATMNGLFKTTTRGTTWSVVNSGLTSLVVTSIAVSPSFGSDKTVFAGTGTGGVFKTTTGGSSWKAANSGVNSVSISSVSLSPAYSSDGTVFAGTDDGGVFTSTDGGTTWSAGDSALSDKRILSLSPSPNYSSDLTYFVGTGSYGIYEPVNGGSTGHSEDGMRNIDLVAEAVSPNFSVDKTVFVATEDRGIFKTTTGGSTWVAVNSGLTNLSPTALVISPNYALDHTLFAGFQGKDGIYKTTDGGTSWTAMNNGVNHLNVQALGISPNFGTDQTLLAGTKGGGWGVYLSIDGGSNWTAVNTGLTKPDVNSFGFSPNFSGDHTVFTGTAQGGIYKSTNGGTSWSAANSGLTDLSVSSISISPNFSTDSILYIGTSSSGVFKSTNKGSSWTPVNTGLTNLSVTSLVISPVYASKPTLFVGTSGSGVFQTLNGGTLWGQVNYNLGNLNIQALGISPGYPCDGTLFAGTEGSSGWRYSDTEAINVCVPPPPPPPSTPIINGISPASGSTGSSVIIAGSHFGASQGTSQVLFNGAQASVSSGNWSDTQVVATVPSGATTGPVVVLVNNISSNGVTFTVTTTPPPSNPVISSLSPVSGNVGITVTISGSNFGSSQGSSTVLFNGVQASIVSGGWSSTQIQAIVPSNATTGPVVVKVNSVPSNGVNFTVEPISPPPALIPAISSLSPFSGTVGTQVTITGSNFGASQGSSQILFNGAPAAVSSGNWSDAQIITTVPSGATTGLVTVIVSSNPSNGVTFTVTAPPPPASPVINNITPVGGFTGTLVTINGSGFGSSQGSSKVLFNGLSADTISVWTDIQIIATVPSGATTGQLVVVVGGNSSNGVVFTVSSILGNVAPVITNINPASAYYTMQVTITGYGFGAAQGTSTVSFNGVLADTIISWSDNQIIVVVPAVSASGVPVVTVNGLPSTAPGVSFVVYLGGDAPDLTVNQISGSISGTSIYVSDVEANGGVSDAVPFSVAFYLSQVPVANPATDTLIGTRLVVNGLKGGGTHFSTGVRRYLIPPTMPIGNYYLCAITDSTNQVAETFENNNNKCTTTTVPVSPNLVMSTLSGTPIGESLLVTDIVVNSGDQPAGSFVVDLYLSTGSTPNPATDYHLGSRTIYRLAGGTGLSSSSRTWAIPTTLAIGNYYLCAIADQADNVPELATTDNTKCTASPLAVAPNLKVSSLSGSVLGTNVSVSESETNVGDQPAGPFTVSYYLSAGTTPDPLADTLIGSRNLTSLSGGAVSSVTINLPIPPSMPIGNYYLCAISDSANTVGELLETDNSKCTSGTLAIAPDLKVSSLSGSLSGANISVSDTQINSGDQPAGPFNAGFYLALTTTPDPLTDVLIGSRSLTSLAGNGATSSATASFAIPSTMPLGNYYLCSIADYTNQVGELVENNNSKCTGSTYAVSPDLNPTAISGTISGATMTASDTEKNSGNQPAGSFKVTFYLANTSTLNALTDVMIGSRMIAGLGVGATDTKSTAMAIPPTLTAGSYYLCSNADADNQVSEASETNNSKCSSVAYVVSPDLNPTAISGTISVATMTASDTEKNSGDQPAGSFKVTFYLANTSTLNALTDVMIGSRMIAGLGVGATDTKSTAMAIPPTLTAGSYYLCSNADADNQVSEVIETNNSKCSSVAYAIAPNLVVSTISGSGSSSSATISPSDTEKNSGSQPAGPFKVGFYLAKTTTLNALTDILIGSRQVTGLAAGATNSATTALAVPPAAPAGTYYICASSDLDNTVVESAETDNSKCGTTLYSVSPDLTVSALTGTLSGTNITATDSNKNSGNQPSGAFPVAFYFAKTTTPNTATDVLIGSRNIGSLGIGATNSATTVLAVPQTMAAGSYYLCAIADSPSQVAEVIETNNSKCTTTTYPISPDLTVSALTGSLTGTNITASDTNKNSGSQPAGAFTVAFYFAKTTTPNTATDVLIGSRNIGSLGVGATDLASTVMAVPPTMVPGSYYLCAISDSPSQVAEVNETNNSKCTTGTYAISPDLKTSSITVLKSGTTLTVNDTQTNSGNQPAGAFNVSFYLSSNNTYETTDILLGSRSIASLDAVNAKNSASTPFTVPGGTAAGIYYVIAVSDSGNTVPELTETNNNLSTTGTITLP